MVYERVACDAATAAVAAAASAVAEAVAVAAARSVEPVPQLQKAG